MLLHQLISCFLIIFLCVQTSKGSDENEGVDCPMSGRRRRARIPTVPEMTVNSHIAHFVRERIVERVVHAKGAGAHGYFTVTDDIRNYTKATPFAHIGKRTKIFVRFSTTAESGSADTILDTRGMGIKFYTEEGNLDLVLNDLPIFPIRYPVLFPSFVRSFKRNPKTHLKDPNMFWDFAGLRPETTHHHIMLFTDFAYPRGYRHMDWAGVHVFKLVNSDNEPVYCKFHVKTNQGVSFFTRQDAEIMAGKNADYALEDLMMAIENGRYPEFDLFIQVMTYEEAVKTPYNPFDITKLWLEEDFPFIKVGSILLNRNPSDYFTEVELAAFDPGNLVPGIYVSPDPMLRARTLSYHDASRYRLGANYNALYINQPHGVKDWGRSWSTWSTSRSRAPLDMEFDRDGQCATPRSNANRIPYFPNSFGGPTLLDHDRDTTDDIYRPLDDEDFVKENFDQVRRFLRKVERDEDPHKMDRLIDNMAVSFIGCEDFIMERALKNFKKVDKTFEQRLRDQIKKVQFEAEAEKRMQQNF